MSVSKNLYLRFNQIEQQNLRGENSMNVRHFGLHVEGLSAKQDVTEWNLTQVDMRNISIA